MTFVFRDAKHSCLDTSKHVSPEPYIGHETYDLKEAPVPFLAKQERRTLFTPNQAEFPGPGHYKITPGAFPNPNSFQFLAKDIINARNNSSVFKSKLPRFPKDCKQDLDKTNITSNHEVSKRQPTLAGSSFVDLSLNYASDKENASYSMGEYQSAQLPPQKQSKKVGKLLKDTKTLITSTSRIPSIPHHKQSFGYQPVNETDLILNRNPLEIHQGTLKDSVGPGQYDLSCLQAIKPEADAACGWSLSKVKRELFPYPLTCPDNRKFGKAASAFSPKNTKQDLGKSDNCNTTSGFQSKQGRFFENKINIKYELLKGKYRRQYQQYLERGSLQINNSHEEANIEKDIAKINKKLQRKLMMGSPGPGYYILPQQKKEDPSDEKSPRFQFFNSRQERFNYENGKPAFPFDANQKQSESDATPKSVSQPLKQTAANKGNNNNIQKRFLVPKNCNPGPGTYDFPKNTYPQQTGIRFSKSERFENIAQFRNRVPGPGEYSKSIPNSSVGFSFEKRVGREHMYSLPKETSPPKKESFNGYLGTTSHKLDISNKKVENDLIQKQEDQYESIAFMSGLQRDCMRPIEKEAEKPILADRSPNIIKGNIYRKKQSKKSPVPTKIPGPGDYEIASSLEKRSHNVTYD